MESSVEEDDEKGRMMEEEEEELVVLRKVGGGERGRCLRLSPSLDGRPVLGWWFAQVALRLFISPSHLSTPPPPPFWAFISVNLFFSFFFLTIIID